MFVTCLVLLIEIVTEKIPGYNYKYAWIGGTNGATTTSEHRWLSDGTVVDSTLAAPNQLDANTPNWGIHVFGMASGSEGKRIGDAPGSHQFPVVCEAVAKGHLLASLFLSFIPSLSFIVKSFAF